jgi:hypothetical protein
MRGIAMEAINVYNDKLVEINNDSITLKNYYFPFATSKRIPFDKIKSIKIQNPSLFTGQARIWGTGDFMTWFPLDLGRIKRDKIFVISIIDKSIRVGFTVENSETVLQIFEQKGLITKRTA